MQSTGQTSTHELSFWPMHGSVMTYGTGGSSLDSAAGALRRDSPGRLTQGAPIGELHSWATGPRRLAGGGLDRVDRLPAVPGDRLRRGRRDERLDVVRDGPVEAAGGHVLQ